MFVGAIVIGLIFALLALLLTSQNTLTEGRHRGSRLNVIEAVIVIIIAYSSYIVSDSLGISPITTMITFGLLQDQYIKHNLSYRSQVAFLDVLSGMRTVSDTLIYTLIGIELVDNSSRNALRPTYHATVGSSDKNANTLEGYYIWNYKFIATLTILTIFYRFFGK